MSQPLSIERLKELERIYFTVQSDLRTKFINVLLMVVVAAIGFAINQTKEAVWSWWLLLCGAALLCWGLSFFFGCRSTIYQFRHMWSGFVAVSTTLDSAGKEVTDDDAKQLKAEVDEEVNKRDGFHDTKEKAESAMNLQFGFFIGGVLCYIFWHVAEILRRTEEYTCLLWY